MSALRATGNASILTPMQSPLAAIYSAHHAARRGDGFVLLGEERGAFLASRIGTGKDVLDIGCRDGALTASFAEGNRVTGIDIDPDALARARERLGIEARQADLNAEWEFAPASFDAIVAAEVIEHLYFPEMVVEKAARTLRDDGLLAGTVPNAFSFAHRARYLRGQKRNTPLMDPTHINHFTVEELRGILAARFHEVEIVGLGRLGRLARTFPQAFAYDLAFAARRPKRG